MCRDNSTVRPSGPTANVLSKPSGGIGLPRLLLVKPERTFDELRDVPRGHGEAHLDYVVAQEAGAPLDPADEGLVRVLPVPLRVTSGRERTSSALPHYVWNQT